jgi:riboflavin kinase/FMN adenylyltransferase
MQIIEWSQFLEELSPLGGNPSAVTVGVFDGVHRGHQALVEQVVSQKNRAVPVVITFSQGNHKKKTGGYGDILTFRQKAAVFESLGISLIIVIEFSESFRRMSGADFLQILHEHGKMRFMAVGSNFRCGYQLDTDAPRIQQINARRDIPTCIVQTLTEDGQPISSSQIRAAVAQGQLKAASAMLGRPFTVDLSGASDFSAAGSSAHRAGGLVYDIAGRGGLLPPPGKYPVLLLGKNSDKNAAKPAEILVEDGNIIIAENLAELDPEFAEF